MQRTLVCLPIALALCAGPAHADDAPASPRRLTFEQVIERCQHNPLAQIAQAETDFARAREREARAARFPQIEVTSFLAPSPRIECIDAGCTETDPNDVRINIAGVFGGVRAQLTQPLYTFGKASAIGHAASDAVEAQRMLEHQVAGDLILRAAQAYYGLKLARELVWMLEDGLDEINSGREKLEERLAEGSGDATVQDRLRLETLTAEVEARLTEAREAEATALAGLRALTGISDADVDKDPLEAVAFKLSDSAEVIADRARAERGDVRAAAAGVAARNHMVSFEKARWFPDLVVIGGLNWAKADGVDNPPSAFANDPFNTLSAQVGLVLRWKVDPASQPARVARARADARRAEAVLGAARAGATFEVRKTYATAEQARKRLDASARGEKAAKAWVASVLQADAIGAADTKDLADALLAYFTSKGRVLQSTYDWNLATVALRKASGEFKASRARR